jgi:hypothetical protein
MAYAAVLPDVSLRRWHEHTCPQQDAADVASS